MKQEILNQKVKNLRYSLHDRSADFYAENIRIENGSYIFNVIHPDGKLVDIVSYYGGRHNIENAIGAIAIALEVGVNETDIRNAIETFRGVKRRFETHIKNEKHIYIDDYAHHPRELDAALLSAKELYPDKKITAAFQPHLFSRTRDLCDEFAASLSKIDQLILLDIYPAREKPIEGVTSKIIFDKVTIADKHLMTKNELTDFIRNHKDDIEVLLTVGAGDIDTKVKEITEILNEPMN